MLSLIEKMSKLALQLQHVEVCSVLLSSLLKYYICKLKSYALCILNKCKLSANAV